MLSIGTYPRSGAGPYVAYISHWVLGVSETLDCMGVRGRVGLAQTHIVCHGNYRQTSTLIVTFFRRPAYAGRCAIFKSLIS